MELERRVHAILEENELLQNTVEDLREKSLLMERQWNDKDLQVQNRKSHRKTGVLQQLLIRYTATCYK